MADYSRREVTKTWGRPTLADPTRVLVAGDWHGNTTWAQSVIRRLPALLPDETPRIIIHCGDFGVWPRGRWYLDAVDTALELADAQLWFVDGNHEDFSQLTRFAVKVAGQGLIRARIRYLPRGHRWTWHNRTWLALGGAVSVDRAARTEGRDWWPAEEITEAQARHVLDAGRADVMVCHDAPARVPLDLPAPPSWWAPTDLIRAQEHRERLQLIVDHVQPEHLLHGHYHLAQRVQVAMPYGTCHVAALDCDGQPGNHGVLNVESMTWEA